MKKMYVTRQMLLLCNQLLLMVYLLFMERKGCQLTQSSCFSMLLVTVMFLDAAYVSYKNVQNNGVLSQFTFLLLLAAWQFQFSLFPQSIWSSKIFNLLLPLVLYQTIYFLQVFIFQKSAYRFQSTFLWILRITGIISVMGYVISEQAFALGLLLQSVCSVLAVIGLMLVHRKRFLFFIKSQKRELLLSILFAAIPFFSYIVVFYNRSSYLENMGSYWILMMSFVSVHSIIFQKKEYGRHIFGLNKKYARGFLLLTAAVLAGIIYLIGEEILRNLVFISLISFFVQGYHILLFLQIEEQPEDVDTLADRRHFYAYSLWQMRREEALRKDFSNYLHDEILQDLLAVKNLAGKAEQPGMKELIVDTLDRLNDSIREQMQRCHPVLLSTLTYKENLQYLMDMVLDSMCDRPCCAVLECDDTLFLVEPYSVMVYRMIQELITNSLKHGKPEELRVTLLQEEKNIVVKVEDNGTGFDCREYLHEEHKGLDSIQEQVGLLGGSINITSMPGKGTHIVITITMRGEESYECFVGR